MKKAEKIDINEIIRLAFLKYRLSNRKSMNTFIFTQAKNNKLTDEQITYILDTLEKEIEELNNNTKPEWQNISNNLQMCIEKIG